MLPFVYEGLDVDLPAVMMLAHAVASSCGVSRHGRRAIGQSAEHRVGQVDPTCSGHAVLGAPHREWPDGIHRRSERGTLEQDWSPPPVEVGREGYRGRISKRVHLGVRSGPAPGIYRNMDS